MTMTQPMPIQKGKKQSSIWLSVQIKNISEYILQIIISNQQRKDSNIFYNLKWRHKYEFFNLMWFCYLVFFLLTNFDLNIHVKMCGHLNRINQSTFVFLWFVRKLFIHFDHESIFNDVSFKEKRDYYMTTNCFVTLSY